MQKKILIVLQTKNFINENFDDNLKAIGYSTTFFPSYNLKVYKPNIFVKIINLSIKLLYPNFNLIKFLAYKRMLKYNTEQNDYIKLLKDKYFDYTIVFRADNLSNDFIKLIKQKSKKTIAYQWDGLNRFQDIYTKIDLFDSFFCFDPADSNQKIRFITNFYFDYLKIPSITNPTWDITYIGYYTDDRMDLLEKISILLNNNNNNNNRINFRLKSFDKLVDERIEKSKHVKTLTEVYTYYELLEIHNNSKVILDIKVDIHNGLSFRFFEALQLRKKLITTNRTVVNYDFYNSNNIFILTNENIEELIDFMEIPYVEIPENIIKKYSFTSWLNELIN